MMAREIYVAHTGTDTWFSLSDTGYLFTSDDVEKAKAEHVDAWESFTEANSADEVAYEYGQAVDQDLANHLYEVAKAYHDMGGEIRVTIDPA
jgi:hypothetical protein